MNSVNSLNSHLRDLSDMADLAAIRQSVEDNLSAMLDDSTSAPRNLLNAMRHALLAPSKRIRPLMVYLVAKPAGSLVEAALRVGSAVEMVHTASLILDDLPCMDDAQMRRRKPTTHMAFGESTAILGAIAMLSRAFGILAELEGIGGDIRTRLAAILSEAVGWNGLVAGQELDINGQAELLEPAAVENLIWLKTGILFVAAAEMGAVLRGATEYQVAAVRRYATHFGLAFQTLDDILDGSTNPDDIGKDVKKDECKTTLVSLFGISKARQTCQHHLAIADAALLETGAMIEPLKVLAERLFAKARTA